jgi:hypothetical protein
LKAFLAHVGADRVHELQGPLEKSDGLRKAKPRLGATGCCKQEGQRTLELPGAEAPAPCSVVNTFSSASIFPSSSVARVEMRARRLVPA